LRVTPCPIKRAGRKKKQKLRCFSKAPGLFSLTTLGGGINGLKGVKGIKALKVAAVRGLRLDEIPSGAE